MAIVSWDASFETVPDGAASPGLGDDAIRELKENTRYRLVKEHVMVFSTAAADGWHKQGSGRAYYTTATPTLLPDGTTTLASDALKAAGRLWVHSTSKSLQVYSSGGFVGILRELTRISVQGTLAIGVNVVPPLCFPRTVSIARIIARVGTVPGTAGNPVYIDIMKRANTGAASASIFTSAANRLTLSNGAYYSIRTTGQMSATKLSITPASWLQIDLDAVGGSTKGANLAVEIEALLR